MLASSKLKQNVFDIQTIGHSIIRLDSVDSTNNYAANLLHETNVVNGTVILAKNQFSGRGQKENKWVVEPNKDLTFSIILNQLSIKVEDQFLLSQWVSISVIQLLKSYGVDAEIKWPNDILISKNYKKIAGILIENSLRGNEINNSIIGVGVNINNSGFQKDMNPTSLSVSLGEECVLDSVFNKLIQLLNTNYILLVNQKEELRELYFSTLLGYNKELVYEDSKGRFKAKITTILPDGRLVLIDGNDEKRIYMFKEVNLII